MGDKERRIAGAERATVGKVCVLNLFFPEAGSIIFQYLENFAFHVNGNRHNLLIFLVVFFTCFICMFV